MVVFQLVQDNFCNKSGRLPLFSTKNKSNNLRIIEAISRQNQTTGLWQGSWWAFHTPLESNCVDVGKGHVVGLDVALKMWDYLW